MAADGSIVFSTEIDDKKAQADLKKLDAKIKKIESELSENTGKKSAIEKQLEDAKGAAEETQKTIAELQAKLKKTTAETGGGDPFSQMYSSQIASAKDSLDEQRTAVDKLEKKYDSITQKVESQTDALNSAKDAAGDLTARLAGAKQQTSGTSAAAAEAAKRMDKFSQHVKTLAKRVLVFSLITSALRKIKDYMWEAIKTNDEAMAAVARLKGALMTLAQPIIEVIIPAFTVLVNVLARIVNAVSRLISALFGTTVQKSAQAAKALNTQKNAIEGVGDAAKEATRYLAGFDELNTLPDNNSSSSSSGGIGANGGIAPDFTSSISDQLSAIVELFTGAALLGLGAILAFSGVNIPLGIALMALGAIAIWDSVTENWDTVKQLLQGPIGRVTALIGSALIVIGVVLLFSGVGIPIGLGLILAGATLLGTAAAANWDTMMDILKNPLDHTDTLIRGYKLSLGVALLFSGVGIPVGLGLIKDSLNRSVSATPRWDYVKSRLVEAWTDIKNWWNGSVKEYFSSSWWEQIGRVIINGLLLGLTGGWGNIVSWVINAVNWIANQFSAVTSDINAYGGGGSSSVGTFSASKMPAINMESIPALARGAVIPPNREFMAVLGDQKRGTNIEAPADLIRQIVREELGSGGEEITIKFTGDLAQLARLLSPEITRQQRRNQRAMGV